MSEQIELDGINLCIPEDAFEKFQASSMYEERECIILPNNEPQQPAPNDRGEDTKVTCSDDVVVRLNSDDEVNTKCDVGAENPSIVETTEISENAEISPQSLGDITATGQKFIHRKKISSKKKSIIEKSSQLRENDSECVAILEYNNGPSESIEDIQNFIQNTNPVCISNRKSRIPKSDDVPTDDLSPSKRRLSKESISESSLDKTRRLSKESLIKSTKESCVLPEIIVHRKRGRPRKSHDSPAVNYVSPSHSNLTRLVDSTEQDVMTKSNNRSKRVLKKRGQPRKISLEEKSYEVDSIVTTDELDPLDCLDSLPDVRKSFAYKKKSVKRGRPKKKRNLNINQLKKEQSDEHHLSAYKTSLSNDDDGDDDDDDVSLSSLSKSTHKNLGDTSMNNEQDNNKKGSDLEHNGNSKTTESLNVMNRQRNQNKLHTEDDNQEVDKIEPVNCDKRSQEDNHKEESLSKIEHNLDTKKETETVEETLTTEATGQATEDESSKIKDEQLQGPVKRNPKVPIMSDFEYNLDDIVQENIHSEKVVSPKHDTNSLLVEDLSKRITRKKVKKTIQYHDESDEDPFANIELSDDEPIMRRKGKRYHSDDEYLPREKRDSTTPNSSDSESNNDLDSDKKSRKRKYTKKSDSQSPRKRGRKSYLEKAREIETIADKKGNTSNVELIDNVEDCSQTSDIKINDDSNKVRDTTTDIESFLAKKIQGTNLKIKKVSPTENADTITPLQIPIIDPNEPKKSVESSTQTQIISTNNVHIQTGCLYDIPMKENVTLSAEQSTKACEFLNGIVTTTVELGKLMTQKSEDFIKKKINTEHVTDTIKMDYCVKKSFLLFKLAKHNLTQMEEDLAKQYDQFLSKHDLLKYREEPKKISPTVKDNDSDCEIIEESVQEKQPAKSVPKFNPKTVFLNKELSIKIAKKPSEDKNINIRGKHTVWINDSVMVKKVKPTQSFLAQDSRNKKPPDHSYVTIKMVSDFFEDYYRKKSLATCALFTSPNWLNMNKNYVCHYFVVTTDFPASVNISATEDYRLNSANSSNASTANTNQNLDSVINQLNMCGTPGPETLLTLCTEVLQKHLPISKSKLNVYSSSINQQSAHKTIKKQPKSLIELCINVFSPLIRNYHDDSGCNKEMHHTVLTLKSLCHQKVLELLFNPVPTNEVVHKNPHNIDQTVSATIDEYNKCHKQDERKIKSLFSLCVESIHRGNDNPKKHVVVPVIKNSRREIKSLFSLCVEFICLENEENNIYKNTATKQQSRGIKSLFSLCVDSIRNGMANSDEYIVCPAITKCKKEVKSLFSLCIESINLSNNSINKHSMYKKPIKSLFSICVEYIRRIQIAHDILSHETDISPTQCTPNSLKHICFDIIYGLLYNNDGNGIANINEPVTSDTLYIGNQLVDAFTINSVDTLSEEAFYNLQNTVDDHYYGDYENGESFFNDEDFVSTYEESEEQNHIEDKNWASQVQMKELRSCANINNTRYTDALHTEDTIDTGLVNSEGMINHFDVTVKTEPLDDIPENMHESISIKIEPIHGLDEMTMIPEIVVTKSEKNTHSQTTDDDHCQSGNLNHTYSVDTFEEFVRKSKFIQAVNEDAYDEIYSQSSLRVRQQYEPDYDGQNDVHDGLLVPHTFTNIYSAKNCLMGSSSDEANSNKNIAKKKPIRRKAKSNKAATKTPNKEVPLPAKDKTKSKTSEVDELTRRMKDRIRQEEKEIHSSESDHEDLPLSVRKSKRSIKEDNKKSVPHNPDDAIQCNDVDSTEQLNNLRDTVIPTDEARNGSSSNSVDLNDSSKSRVNMKKRKNKTMNLSHFTGPMELLECEPTIHEYNDDIQEKAKELNNTTISDNDTARDNVPQEGLTDCAIHDRCGWLCYPVDTKDKKLYQGASVLLQKLPESFVQTYFQYQEIGEKDEVDREIDRLTNVNSLNRAYKDKVSTKSRNKVSSAENNKPNQPELNAVFEDSNESRQFHELAPSDDETANIKDEQPSVVPMRHGENNIARNALINDESEAEENPVPYIKQEPIDNVPQRKRPGPKSKTKVDEEKIPDSELVLTADKMMKEELTLLHTPPTLNQLNHNVVETTSKETGIKPRRTFPRKVKLQIKSEEDSSSEEEKQWVSTKEKLLKKMKNRQDASVSDARRAKMVTEFIEKRGVGSESRKVTTRGKYRGSKKKFLEREKQLRVLSKELYGESSTDAAHPRKSYFSSNYKGRRNIRKVIDKKSLKQSTVKAIMEEFERKRRLNDKQIKLREHLGCEENVNVLVINDEVCLEYDFEEDRPVVTVHQFFTKVMKAHQYEGVKFMWDACFESLSRMQAGHPGGGCILAHCMGLGKTLQVLALLHTVLTHPKVGMKRVLVCCPLSTVLNWVDEIHKWIGPVTNQLKVFELSKLKKTYERAYQLEDWYTGGGIFIIGYELFRSLTTLDPTLDDVRPTIVKKIRTALLDPGPDIVVCDEGHLLKNDCSVLAVAMSRVATRRRIVLTGTPMQNNLREYYCMVNFIKPNLLGSYAEYSNRFANPIMNGQHRDSSTEDIRLMKTRTHILHKILEGCLQRQEAAVLYPYLPKKHEYTVFIPLTKCQWDLYKHYMHTYCTQNKQGILKDFHFLQKIWSHPQVLHNFQTKLCDYKKAKEEKLEDDLAQEDLGADDIKPSDTEVWWLQHLDGGNMLDSLESSNKFVAVFRILKECVDLGDKVLIFSTSLFCLDSLEFFLKKINKWSLGQEYYRLDGSVPAEVRHKWCREFNAENNVMTKLFLISTRAGCLGLNMTAANRVIILDTSWNPAHDIQSIFRVYRFGQKKDCFIYRLVAMGTMEQKIYERSVTKQAVACRVVDEQQIDRHYNSADLAELYRLDEAGGSVAGGVAAGVRDVALLRVARDGPVHAVHEHDSLLRASEPALPEHERAAAWHQFQLERAAEQNDNEPSAKKPKLTAKNTPKEKPTAETDTTLQKPGTSKTKKEDGNNSASNQIQNSTPTSENDYKNDIVNTVIHNLIKLSYPKMQDAKEMGEIVKVVRHIVANVPATEENKDRVSMVITENLLKHLKEHAPVLDRKVCKNMNEGENIEQKAPEKPQKTVVQPQKKSERLKEKEKLRETRKQYIKTTIRNKKSNMVYEEVVSVSQDETVEVNENEVEACSSNSTEIGLVGETPPKETPPPTKKTWKRIASNEKKRVRTVEQATASENSILLSDDDDISVVQTSEPPVINQNTPKPQSRSKNLTKTPKNNKVGECHPVPLHPSILSNNHFIAIVAHTYLEGNPMLDSDAATLAAKYSTLKAKKEMEETGRSITNGPLYDIAVRVLGIDVLKRLHSVRVVSPVNTMAQMEAEIQLEESVYELEKASEIIQRKKIVSESATPAPSKQPSKPIETAKEINQQSVEKMTITPPSGSTSNVVPVELFKGPSIPGSRFTRQNREECILPDDDSPMTAKEQPDRPQTDAPTQSEIMAAKLLHNQKTKPIILKRLLSAKALAPNSKVKMMATDSKNSVNTFNKIISTSAGNIVLDPNKISSTICLDSDDEDTPPAPVTTTALGPVPVALTTVSKQAVPGPSLTSTSCYTTPNRTNDESNLKTTTPIEDKTASPQQRKPLILKIRSSSIIPLQAALKANKPDASAVKNTPAVESKKITLVYTTNKTKPIEKNMEKYGSKKIVELTTDCRNANLVSQQSSNVQQSNSANPGPSSSFKRNDKPDYSKNVLQQNHSKVTRSLQEVKASYGFKKDNAKTKDVDAVASNKDQASPLPIILGKMKALSETASTSQNNKDKITPKEAKQSKASHKKPNDVNSTSCNKANNAALVIDLTSNRSKSKKKENSKRVDAKQNYESYDNVIFAENLPSTHTTETIDVTRNVAQKTSRSKSSSKSKSLDPGPTSSTTAIEKKRPSTSTDTKPPKKKKLRELTLQDFDIDDLDDIIELE